MARRTRPSPASARPSNSTRRTARAHYSLGIELADKGEADAATACFKKAIQLDPKSTDAHFSLGILLCDVKREYDEAIASFRKVIELDPKRAMAHCNLGIALFKKGQDDEAIASFRKAIELDPKLAEAHCNLGHALKSQGRFTEALAALKRGHELGSKRPGWRYPSAQWVRQARRMVALEAKLPAFLKGRLEPRDTAERLGLVAVCQAKKLPHAATRLYADAFAADPRLVDDLKAGHRYNAACAAALAAAGQGEGAAQLSGSERMALRRRALTWLRAELALWTRLVASGEVGRSRLARILSHWRKDANLASIRDKDALAKLSAEERAAFEKFWADVTALPKTQQKGPAGKPVPVLVAAAKRYREVAASKGANHIDTLLARRDWGQLCLRYPQHFDEGEAMLVEVMQALRDRPADDPIREFTLGLVRDCLEQRRRMDRNNWKTFNVQAAVGGELLNQKKYAQAERMLLAACKGLKAQQVKLPVAGTQRLRQALQDLVQLYEARGKKEEAAKWRKQLEALKPQTAQKQP
jgi:TolA-binding protein